MSQIIVSQDRIDATAAKLWRLEATLDQALILQAELTAELAAGRMEAGLAASVGHRQIFAELPAIGASIVAARGGAVDLHAGLSAFGRRYRLTTGSVPPKKEEDGFTEQDAPLGAAVRLVASRPAA